MDAKVHAAKRWRPDWVVSAQPSYHLLLPACLQSLDALAEGQRGPFDPGDQPVSMILERRVADAFRCLGFTVTQLGQGKGRKADALAQHKKIAVIIDAKVRADGYRLGTEDRKFLDYAIRHGAELQRQGYERIYFAVVGSQFKENDAQKLKAALSESPIKNAVMITARKLMQCVEDSIRNRHDFTVEQFEKEILVH